MTQYRTMSVEVDAVQVLAADYNGVDFDDTPFSDFPEWLQTAVIEQTIVVSVKRFTDYAEWALYFRGEEIIVTPGDWIVIGKHKELIPIRGDTFDMIFEKVV